MARFPACLHTQPHLPRQSSHLLGLLAASSFLSKNRTEFSQPTSAASRKDIVPVALSWSSLSPPLLPLLPRGWRQLLLRLMAVEASADADEVAALFGKVPAAKISAELLLRRMSPPAAAAELLVVGMPPPPFMTIPAEATVRSTVLPRGRVGGALPCASPRA